MSNWEDQPSDTWDNGRVQHTHSAECWRWHRVCAVDRLEKVKAIAVDGLLFQNRKLIAREILDALDGSA